MKTKYIGTAALILMSAFSLTVSLASAEEPMGSMTGHSAGSEMHHHMMMSSETMMASNVTPAADHRVGGEVKKIDVAKGEIKIRHEAIRHLDMMAMTMVFKARDKADLANLKVGDHITFQAENIDGVLTAIAIKKQ